MARPVRIAILADARQAKGELKSFEKETGRIGSALKTGLAIGAAAAGAGLVKMFSDGVKAAEDYLTLQRKTAAVIKSTGNAAKISVKGVAKLAGELESLSGIDEDLIINSQNVLATFTSVRNGVKKSDRIFDQATATIVDMSAALGTDLQGATIQVGKALNDPVKGITALSRVGVSFTKSQKDQIKALVESGQTMKAQKLILAELNKEFGGAAKAAGGTGFTGALNRAKDAFGDLNRDILIGVLPTLTKVADWFRLKVVPAVGEFAESVRTQLIPGIKRAFKLVSDKLPPIDISKAFKAGSKRAKEWVQPIIDSFEVGARTGNYGALGLTLGEKVGDAITGVTGKLGAAFSKVDWVQLGKDVGRTALPFIIGFANALFDPLFDGGFWAQHWKDVLLFGVAFIPLGKGASFAGRIAEKLGLAKGITGAVIKGLEGAAGALAAGVSKTVRFIAGNFAKGFGAAFPEVSAAVRGFAQRSGGGLNAFVAQAKLVGSSGAATLVRMVGLGLGSGVRAMISWGTRLAREIWIGIRLYAGKFKTVLKDAGVQTISGFLQGLQQKWNDVVGWLRAKTAEIPFHKGPPRKDATLLVKSGRLIMGGFLTGLQSKYGTVKGSLKSFTAALAKDAITKLVAIADQRKQVVANLIQAKNELSAAVRDNLRGPGVAGLVDFSTVAPSARADSVVRALQDRLKAVRDYASGVKALAARGLGASVTKQLLDAGLDGAPVVDALRRASPAIIKQIASIDSRIARESATFGNQLSGLVFNQSIGKAQRVAAQPVRLVIDSGGSQLDKLLIQVLRKAIRGAGGNVQVVLGTGRA